MSTKILVFFSALTVVLMNFAVERVDDACFTSNAWQSRSWNDNQVWLGGAYPRGGGRASFYKDGWWNEGSGANYNKSYFNQNVGSLSLQSIDLAKMNIDLKGNQIDMVGQRPVLAATEHSISVSKAEIIYWPRLSLVLNGDGENVLAKHGSGPIFVNKAPTNFAAIDAMEGTLVLTNTAIDISSATQPLVIKTGKVLVTPPNGGTLALANVKAAEGLGRLTITNAATASLTTLTRGSAGVLRFEPSNDGKIVNPGRAAGTAVDAGLVFVDNGIVKFADYSETDGFIPGSGTPANAVVLGAPDAASGTTTSTGEITKEYVFCQASSNGTTKVNLNGAISVDETTIAAVPNKSQTVTVYFDSLPQSTTKNLNLVGAVRGSSTVDGASAGAVQFPFVAGSTVSIYGNNLSDTESPLLSISFDHPKYFHNNFQLAGGEANGKALAINGNGWMSANAVVDGNIALLEDSAIESNTDLRFTGAVSGDGGITKFGAGSLRLASANTTYAGTTKVKAGTVYANGSGHLGTGDINLTTTTAELGFSDTVNLNVVSNYFTGSQGRIVVQNAQVRFKHPVTVNQLSVQDKYNRTPYVILDADMTAKYLINDTDCYIAAGETNVTLTTGGGSWNSVIRGDLRDGTAEDGAGKLSLVKTGSNMAILASTNNTYSGRTVVNAGTLKLGPGGLGGDFSKDDVPFWLDASDKSTLTYSTVSGTNFVSEWRSKVGANKLTSPSWSTMRPVFIESDASMGEGYFNNRSFLRFTFISGKTLKQNLLASAKQPIRTLFVVCRQLGGSYASQGALINYEDADCSFRVGDNGYMTARRDSNDGWTNGRGSGDFYHNGVRRSYALLKDNPSYSFTHVGAHTISCYLQRKYYGYTSYIHEPEWKLCVGSVGRDWDGDVGEVIAFNRYLSQPEVEAVENYLFAKWNPDHLTQHAESGVHVERRVNYIPAASDLEISKGAILDLNGSDQTVASLAGDGIVTNSSTTAAKLTVTGSATAFHGTLTGNVRLTVASGGQEICVRNDATLVLSGSNATTLKPGNMTPPTDSVIVWVDASESDTVFHNADNQVTFWTNSNNGVECSCVGLKGGNGKAYYIADGWTNRTKTVVMPAIDFGLHNSGKGNWLSLYSSMNATASAKCGTLFLVIRYNAGDNLYSFNFTGSDTGLVGSPTGVNVWDDPHTLAHIGDTFRVNGIDASSYSWYTISGPMVIAFRPGDTHYYYNASHLTGSWSVGGYNGNNRNSRDTVAAVIGYSRRLTDAEIIATERYLMNKWITPETQNTSVFDSTCTLAANGAAVDLGSEALSLAGFGSGTYTSTGGFTVREGITLDVANGKIVPAAFNGNVTFGDGTTPIPLTVNSYSQMLSAYPSQPAVTVSGTVSGSLATDETEHPKWLFNAGAKAWSFIRHGMMILLK